MPSRTGPSLIEPLNDEDQVVWNGAQDAAPVMLSRGAARELRTIGHKVDRFLAARTHWWKQAQKPEFAALPPWARGTNAPPAGHLDGDGVFACRLIIHAGDSLLLPDIILPRDPTARLLALWQKVDAQAPATPPAPLAVPDDANDALWLALLRLRPLRGFWDRELRRATVDALLQMLPDAWVLDPARVPEGAVIPRLDLASWSGLSRFRETGRAFAITAMHGAAREGVLDSGTRAETWSGTVATALAAFQFQSEPKVLVDMTGTGDVGGSLLVAFYHRSGGRVEPLGAMALTPAADGRLLPGRVAAA